MTVHPFCIMISRKCSFAHVSVLFLFIIVLPPNCDPEIKLTASPQSMSHSLKCILMSCERGCTGVSFAYISDRVEKEQQEQEFTNIHFHVHEFQVITQMGNQTICPSTLCRPSPRFAIII